MESDSDEIQEQILSHGGYVKSEESGMKLGLVCGVIAIGLLLIGCPNYTKNGWGFLACIGALLMPFAVFTYYTSKKDRDHHMVEIRVLQAVQEEREDRRKDELRAVQRKREERWDELRGFQREPEDPPF